VALAHDGFELLGSADDETRLLVHRPSGYALPVPGHPRIVDMAANASPVYDLVLAMTDLPIEVGVRLDEVPAGVAPATLATSLALAFTASRVATTPMVREDLGGWPGAGATAGASCAYALRDDASRLEALTVTVRAHESGCWVMYRTLGFVRDDVNPVRWANIRTAMAVHTHWDPTAPRAAAPAIWPATSELAAPGAVMRFTPAAAAEARTKADALGAMSGDDATRLLELLLRFSDTDDPPTHPQHPYVLDLAARQLAMGGPPEVTEVLLRNLGQIQSTYDLRAWCWQCIWAMGNRVMR